MITMSEMRNILSPGVFTVSLDLKVTYWHVPIKSYFLKYLGFCLRSQKHCFLVLPFGLNITPHDFTKLKKPILREFHLVGIEVVAYLNDRLVWDPKADQCRGQTARVLETIRKRGFLINLKKSCLDPSQQFQWLCLSLNNATCGLSLLSDKRQTLRRDLQFVKLPLVSRRQDEKIQGKI